MAEIEVFENQDLSNTDMRDRDLVSARFENCNLTGANFEDVDLAAARFTNCDLTNANFRGAALSGGKPHGAWGKTIHVESKFHDCTYANTTISIFRSAVVEDALKPQTMWQKDVIHKFNSGTLLRFIDRDGEWREAAWLIGQLSEKFNANDMGINMLSLAQAYIGAGCPFPHVAGPKGLAAMLHIVNSHFNKVIAAEEQVILEENIEYQNPQLSRGTDE